MKVKKYDNTSHYCITHDRLNCYVDVKEDFNQISFYFPGLIKGTLQGTDYSREMIKRFSDMLNKIYEITEPQEGKGVERC